MKKRIIVLLLLAFFLIFPSLGRCEGVKKPNVAGGFYPASPKALQAMVDKFIENAEVPVIDGRIKAVLAPHAGYIYSGPVAGYSFKMIKDKEFKSVIIIGPSHYVTFKGASVYPEGAFQTPLGKVGIDAELAAKIMNREEDIRFLEDAFSREHSVEVELPFLQRALNNFKFVPIVIGKVDGKFCSLLARRIKDAIGLRDDVFIVASSDMYHGYNYNDCQRTDRETLAALKALDIDWLRNKMDRPKCYLCGLGPVIIAIEVVKNSGADKAVVLKHSTSGDVTGKKEKGDYCVGYGSVVFYKERRSHNMLNDEEKKILLKLARETMETYIKKKKIKKFKIEDPLLKKEFGAFVTIHKKGRLRGCIGNIIGKKPLYITVRDMAIASSTQDSRFPTVQEEELGDIDIELSVLTPPEKIDDPNKIELGRHGVIVKKGYRSGVFLPQVATETGWSREEFMSNLCSHKAGLPPDAWKIDKDVEIFVFTAQVFGEQE